jgi:predicted HTH transcriptional regulator
MAINDKPISEINEYDLKELISLGIPESKTIEYKNDLPGNLDDEKKEFLADVSSFSNSNDGLIIYGIEAKDGIPIIIRGINDINEKDIIRIDNIIRDGITPRIPGIKIHKLLLSTGLSVVIIKIPKSWISPHMVSYRGSSRFYSRHSAGKYRLDVNEIRSAFLASETITNKIKDFHIDRLNKIISNDTPIPLPDGAKVILHIIPINNFLSRESINFIFFRSLSTSEWLSNKYRWSSNFFSIQ